MNLVCFNINGIRARLHQIEMIIDMYDPDVIGLQETKVIDDSFPLKDIQAFGYEPVIHGQKAHYGVALLSKKKPIAVEKGFPTDDDKAQRRLIAATYEMGDGKQVKVINGYFPQGASRDHETKFPAKKKFYEDLQKYLEEQHDPKQHLVVMGDFNIAPQDHDIGIGEDNAKRWLRTGKASFLPEEREWMQRLMGWGLHDSYRMKFPEEDDRFSWFDYRSRGFETDPRRGLRIDMIMVSDGLKAHVEDAGIDYDIRAMNKPSDHCPIWLELKGL